jgi:hypothetical protein
MNHRRLRPVIEVHLRQGALSKKLIRCSQMIPSDSGWSGHVQFAYIFHHMLYCIRYGYCQKGSEPRPIRHEWL